MEDLFRSTLGTRLDTSWGLHNVEFGIPWLTGNLQKIRIVFWGVAMFLLFIVCSADLDMLCSGSFSHRVKRGNDGEGVRRRTGGERKYLLHSTPWDFWNSVRQLTEQAVFLIYRQNVKQANVSKVRVSVQTCEYTFHQQGYLELRKWNDELTYIKFSFHVYSSITHWWIPLF